jgi:hypothetical protein
LTVTNEAQRNEDTVEPLVRLHPFDRVREIILFALWREIHGDCPTTTADAMRKWRQYAIDRYRHDNVLHHKVEYVAHAVVDAAGDFFKPNKSVTVAAPAAGGA